MIPYKKDSARSAAEINGVDCPKFGDPEDVKAIRQALWKNMVIFFRGQKQLDDDEHIRIGQ